MLIVSDYTKNALRFKFKVISSLVLAACLDQFNFFQFLPLQPNISFLTLYFWSFFFRHHLSFLLVFLFGMGVDLIGGSFLGENTLIFIVLYGSISFYQEHFANDLALEWSTFPISLLFLTILQFTLMSIIHERFVFSFTHVGNNALNLVFYPLIKHSLQWWIKERQYP